MCRSPRHHQLKTASTGKVASKGTKGRFRYPSSTTYRDRSCADVISRCVVLFLASCSLSFPKVQYVHGSCSTHTATTYRFYTVTRCPGTHTGGHIAKWKLYIQNEGICIELYVFLFRMYNEISLISKKVYFKSQLLECSGIRQNWSIYIAPVSPNSGRSKTQQYGPNRKQCWDMICSSIA